MQISLIYFVLLYVTPFWNGEKISYNLKLYFCGIGECFYKWYEIVQIDEQVYMALKSIEQGPHEKLEVYYERIFKLPKNLQDKIKDSLLITFFRAGLQPYLCVAMALAKCDNLFQQKEVDVQCEKNMGNVKDDWKSLNLPTN